MKGLKIIILICSIILVKGGSIVNKCKGTGILPDVLFYPSIEKEPCQKSPCEVKPGSTAYIAINFTSPHYLENIKPKVLVSFPPRFEIDYSFGLGQKDACDGLKNTVCPLVEKEEIQYELSLKLESWFPKIGVSLEFSIVDEDLNTNVICFDFDVSVV